MNGEKKQKIESLRYPLQKLILEEKSGRIILGYGIIAVPTGIVGVEIARQSGQK